MVPPGAAPVRDRGAWTLLAGSTSSCDSLTDSERASRRLATVENVLLGSGRLALVTGRRGRQSGSPTALTAPDARFRVTHRSALGARTALPECQGGNGARAGRNR